MESVSGLSSGESWIRQGKEAIAEMKTPPLRFSAAREQVRICAFVKDLVKKANAKGVVVGISGGVGSAVVAAICVKALGKKRVLGLLLPSDTTPGEDMADARRLATKLGIRTVEVGISPIVEALLGTVGIEGSRIGKANVQARARMMILYFFANSEDLLVAGTGDRSEIEIGFFTKYGDGGVDFLPIGHLYKTQVRELGDSLDIPRSIIGKPSSPGLWPGHRAIEEIPVEYDKLDTILVQLLDEGSTRRRAAERTGVAMEIVDKVMKMRRKTIHKRNLPPTLTVWERSRPPD